jgi:SulP family sulfate permease
MERALSPLNLLNRIHIVGTLRGYRREYLRGDLTAALTVALFAIPQSMAYALVAGVPPVHGLYAAIVACVLGAAFGSSNFLIDGPTNAISVMLAANLGLLAGGSDPVAVMLAITVVTGIRQITVGALRLGSITRFVSMPVLHGFTAGAGVYIVAGQLPAMFGFPEKPPPIVVGDLELQSTCVTKILGTVLNIGETNLVALALALGTFAVIRGIRWYEKRTGKRLPATLIGIATATLACELLGLSSPGMGEAKVKIVQDIQEITRALPSLHMPDFMSVAPQRLLGPAAAIAVLGSIEAIAIARTLADRSGQDFDPNQQLVGEGVANVGTGLFGGITSSGSFTRSAVNYGAGAQTRLSGVLCGLLVLVLLLVFAPLANRIPIAALAGSLLHVALILVDPRKIKTSMTTTRADRWGLLVTFTLVLLLSHLEQALLVGIAVSLAIVARRAERFELHRIELGEDGELHESAWNGLRPDERVLAVDVNGELFFAAVDAFERQLRPLTKGQVRFLILRLRNARNLDSTVCEGLLRLAQAIKSNGGRLVLAGVPEGTEGTLRRSGVIDHLGERILFPTEGRVYRSTRHAIEWAHQQLREER